MITRRELHQLFDLKRLGDKIGGAALDRFDGRLDGAEAGNDDGDDFRERRRQRYQQ